MSILKLLNNSVYFDEFDGMREIVFEVVLRNLIG